MNATPTTIQKIVLLFWSVYFTLISLTNSLDALKVLGIIPKNFTFTSGNFDFVVQTTAPHGVPMFMNVTMFAGVLLLESSSAVLFWRAFKNSNEKNLYTAFAVGLILFAGFIISDEIFISYAIEATHIRIFLGLLVSLITIIFLKKYEREKLD